MGLSFLEEKPRSNFAQQQATRGYHVVFRKDECNSCPGCGRSQWLVGRISAECAFCETAIDLSKDTKRGGGGLITRRAGAGGPPIA